MLDTKRKVINYLKKNKWCLIIWDDELSSDDIIKCIEMGIFNHSFVSKILLNK